MIFDRQLQYESETHGLIILFLEYGEVSVRNYWKKLKL